METTDCTVCANSIKNPIVCPKCSYLACKDCTRKYILSLQTIDPKCMACKIVWSLDFIYENMDKEFYEKVYKTHRAKIMFEREQSLLPETQHIVEEQKRVEKLLAASKKYSTLLKERKAKLELFKGKRNRIKEKLADPHLSSEEKKELKSEAKSLLDSERRKLERIKAIKVLSRKARNEHRPQRRRGETPQVKKSVFTARCPAANCNGFVTKKEDEKGQKTYSCGLCETIVCKKCLELKEDEHKCDPNILETVKALKNETRNCPKCQTLIYKISGCDQMYCTQCHTPFSWRTGEVETGRIHNPHYYEYQRQVHGTVPREVGDRPAGPCGQPGYVEIYSHLGSLGANWRKLGDFHRLIGHIRDYICRRVFSTVQPPDVNLNLRVKYLRNEITKDKFISLLKMRDKKYEKNQVVNMVMTMFCDTADVLLGNMLTCTNRNQVTKVLEEIENLRNYTNSVLRKAYARFKNKMPLIDEDFYLDRTYMLGIDRPN